VNFFGTAGRGRQKVGDQVVGYAQVGCAIPFREKLQEISKNITDGLQVGFKPGISSVAIHRVSSSFNRSTYGRASAFARPATWELTMSEKDNSAPLFSPFEIERQARIRRSLVIQSYVRGTMRAFAEWLRTFVLRSTQLTRGLAAQRRIYSDIREL
jgi:hypothetical protein